MSEPTIGSLGLCGQTDDEELSLDAARWQGGSQTLSEESGAETTTHDPSDDQGVT